MNENEIEGPYRKDELQAVIDSLKPAPKGKVIVVTQVGNDEYDVTLEDRKDCIGFKMSGFGGGGGGSK